MFTSSSFLLIFKGFSVKLGDGLKSASFKPIQKIYIDPGKLLPVERFLGNGPPRGGGRGRGGPGGRGGGGFFYWLNLKIIKKYNFIEFF
jgi:hypothetical protein